MKQIELDFKTFPTTRYQGSKRKILPWIWDAFKTIEFDTVLDVCGGSGSVSYLLKKMGKSVTYNDKLLFNHLIGKAIIENSKINLINNDISDLTSYNNLIEYKETIANKFKGIYYLPKENRWLDMIANNIQNMNHYSADVLEYKKALAYYALFQSSMTKRPFNIFHRKNLKIRTNEVKRNFGNKTTWERPFDECFLKFANEVNSLVFDSGVPCFAVNESILEIEPAGYDLVYIDPPYLRKDGSNESSDYLKCYHFLEGLAKYSEWDKMIDYNTLNLRFKDQEMQNDFKSATVYDTFEKILYRFRESKIVVSYKKGGIPSIRFIVDLLKKQGKIVTTTSLHYKYALNHQNGDAKNNREVLIIGI